MFKLRNIKKSGIDKFKVALGVITQEFSILRFSSRYKISHKEAREFKKWCREVYYYKSYKTPEDNPL